MGQLLWWRNPFAVFGHGIHPDALLAYRGTPGLPLLAHRSRYRPNRNWNLRAEHLRPQTMIRWIQSLNSKPKKAGFLLLLHLEKSLMRLLEFKLFSVSSKSFKH